MSEFGFEFVKVRLELECTKTSFVESGVGKREGKCESNCAHTVPNQVDALMACPI